MMNITVLLDIETRIYIFLKGSVKVCTCLAYDTNNIRNAGLAQISLVDLATI